MMKRSGSYRVTVSDQKISGGLEGAVLAGAFVVTAEILTNDMDDAQDIKATLERILAAKGLTERASK